MKIHDSYDQHSIQWYEVRAGKLTASEADRLVSPLGKVRAGDGVRTLMLEKLAEKWLGAPLPNDASSFMIEQGQLLEAEALPAFECESGMPIKRVAFIETDDGKCGCSPDFVVDGQNIGGEAKCPGIVNHLRHLLGGVLPEDYILQVQFSMFVTGWDRWMFISFRRRLAPLILTVHRDDKIQAAITEAVKLFNEQLDAAWEKLCRLNGGPPTPRKPFVPSSTERPKFTWESQMPS